MPVFVSASMTIFVSHSRSSAILLSCHVLAPVFHPESSAILLFHCVFASISYPGSLVILLSCCVSTLAASANFSLLCYAFDFCCRILAPLLSLLVLGLFLFFGSSTFKTFKQSLSIEPWPYGLTSFAKFFHLFLALGTYNLNNNNNLHNLTNTNKLKRGFNTPFINSRPLASNHDQKKVNLSFASCKCPDAVKFNRS